MSSPITRQQTPIDAALEGYLDEYCGLNPIFATFQGVLGHDHALPDLSPEGLATAARLRERTLRDLNAMPVADAVDEVSLAAAGDLLGVELELYETGEDGRRLNNIDSPVQTVRDVFDLMPTATDADWQVIAARLAAVPQALEGYAESLRDSLGQGQVAARRQVLAALAQIAGNVGGDGFFGRFVAQSQTSASSATARALTTAADAAADAYAQLATCLEEELLPQTTEADAVGRDRYALLSRYFLGTALDLEQTYRWGQEELLRVREEMNRCAGRILPGADVAGAVAALEADPARQLADADALLAWMQETSDAAVVALAGSHFDIPEPVRHLQCRIAPTSSGVIYYTGPSEDFSRPGSMWWSIPAGVTSFTTWQERTTVYHEGVPGHHLQIGQTMHRRDLLNKWRRMGIWVSGQGEGWALYAEQLMAELGYLEDPGDYLGMLTGQALRAARVVIDIGFHCGFPAPEAVGGGAWTWDKAWELLTANCLQSPETLRFELTRYLGWPGQAASYKLGERAWLELREAARTARGSAFDLKEFHRQALDLGSVGLDVLREALLTPER